MKVFQRCRVLPFGYKIIEENPKILDFFLGISFWEEAEAWCQPDKEFSSGEISHSYDSLSEQPPYGWEMGRTVL